MRKVLGVAMVVWLAACEDVRVAHEPPPSRVVQAASALQLTLQIEELRPAARAIGSRSFGEDMLNELQVRLTLVRELLSDEASADPRRAHAAAIALQAVGIAYDLVRTDYEAVSRGFSRVSRSSCNRGVEATNLIATRMAADWKWPLEHPDEADDQLSRAATLRNNVMAAAEVTNVAKPAVTIASMASTTLAVQELASRGPAFARVAAWLRGQGGAGRLAAVGEGAGVGIQVVGAGGALVLTEAEIIALAQAGRLSGLALSLIYLARGHLHHICTDKNWISDSSGGPWSPRFKDFFDDAQIGFDDPANLVEVEGHVGPHPKRYHQIVFRRLQAATERLVPRTAQYRAAVLRTLKDLAKEITTPGTELNLLVTGGAS